MSFAFRSAFAVLALAVLASSVETGEKNWEIVDCDKCAIEFTISLMIADHLLQKYSGISFRDRLDFNVHARLGREKAIESSLTSFVAFLGFFFVALTKAREGPRALPDFGVAVKTTPGRADDPMSNAAEVTSDEVAGVVMS